MGIWLEVKEKTICRDTYCVAQTVIESVLEKVGLNTQIKKVEKHIEKLGKLLSLGKQLSDDDNPYTFEVGSVKIEVYDVEFEIIECHLEGECEGYVTASVFIDGDAAIMKEVAKAMAKNLGIDKYLRCE